jgi:hypothetical protein
LTLDVAEDRVTTRLSSVSERRAEAAMAGFAWPEPDKA